MKSKIQTKIESYLNGFNYGMRDAFSTGNYKDPRNPKYSGNFGSEIAKIGYTEGFNTYGSLKNDRFIIRDPSNYYLPERMNNLFNNSIFRIMDFRDVQRYYNIYKGIDIWKPYNKRMGYKIRKRDYLEKIEAINKERFINYENFSEETKSIHHIKYNEKTKNFEINRLITTRDIFKSSLIYFISNPSDANLDIKQDLIYISYSNFNSNNILPTSIKLKGDDICFEYNEDSQNFFDFLAGINKFFKENYIKENLKDFIIVTSDNHSFWISIIIPFCLLFNKLIKQGKSIIFSRGNIHKNGHLIYNGDILEYLDKNKEYEFWEDPIINKTTSEIRAILLFKTDYLQNNQFLIKQTNYQILNFIKIINNSIYSNQIIFIKGDSNYETKTHIDSFRDYYRITLQHNNINYDYLFKHGIRGTLGRRSYELFCINFDTTKIETIKKIIYADILYMYGKNIDTNLPMLVFIDKCKKQMGDLLNNKRVVIYGHSLDYLLVNMVLRNADYSKYIKKVHYPKEINDKQRLNWFLTQTTLFYPKYFISDLNPYIIEYFNPIPSVLNAQNEMIEKIDNDPLNIINAICLDNIRAQSYSLTDMADKKFYGSKLNLNFNMTLIKLIIIMVIILIIIIVIILICNKTFKKKSFEPN